MYQQPEKYFDNIIVVDMESSDGSYEYLLESGVQVLSHSKVENFDGARTIAIAEAKTEWILVNDADEFVTEKLVHYIINVIADNKVDAVELPWANNHLTTLMTYLSPQYFRRLFKKNKIKWENYKGYVHTGYEFESDINVFRIEYKYPEICVHHFSSLYVSEVISKIDAYTTLEVLKSPGVTKISGIRLIMIFLKTFLSEIFIRKAYKDKYQGVAWALLNSCYRFITLLKQYEQVYLKDRNLSYNKREVVQKLIEDNKI